MLLPLVGHLNLTRIEDSPLASGPDRGLGAALSCTIFGVSSLLHVSQSIRGQQILLLDLLLGQFLWWLLISIYDITIANCCGSLALSLALTSLSLALALMSLRKLLIMAYGWIALLGTTLQAAHFFGIL